MLMKAVFCGLFLAAVAQMAQAQSATNTTSPTTTTSTTNTTACTGLTDACKRQANAILANITALVPKIFQGGIKAQVKAFCSELAGKAKCFENAARSPVCKNIPDVVKRFDSITIPRTCGGLCNLPNIALALTAALTAMLIEKLHIF